MSTTPPAAAPAPQEPDPNQPGSDSSDSTTSSLAEILAAFRAATPAERQEIATALAAEDPASRDAWQAATVVNHQIDSLANLLALDPDEASLLLAPSWVASTVNMEGLVMKIATHIDRNWADLAPNLSRLNALVGGEGRRVVRSAVDLVNRARRKRGEQTISVVLQALDAARQEIAAEAMPPGSHAEIPEQRVVDRVLQLANEMIEEHAGLMGRDPRSLVVGFLTGSELRLLSDCKAFVLQKFGRNTSPDAFRSEVWRVYRACKRSNYSSPQTADAERSARKRSLETLDLNLPPAVDLASAMQNLQAHLRAEARARGFGDGDISPAAYPVP